MLVGLLPEKGVFSSLLEQFEIKGIGRGDRDLVTLSSQTLGNLAEEDLRAANG
jgi:hypothetical protein